MPRLHPDEERARREESGSPDGTPVLEMTLELRRGDDPIVGRVLDAGGVDRPFSGWLGLITAIESARAEDSQGDGEEPSTATGGTR